MNITHLENEILPLLIQESASNGHDFGILENVKWNDRKQLGGVVSSLQAKGFIVEIEKAEVDGQTFTQYVLSSNGIVWFEDMFQH